MRVTKAEHEALRAKSRSEPTPQGSARIKTYALSINHRGQPIGLSHRELICNSTGKVLKRTRLAGVLLNWAKRHGYRIESVP